VGVINLNKPLESLKIVYLLTHKTSKHGRVMTRFVKKKSTEMVILRHFVGS